MKNDVQTILALRSRLVGMDPLATTGVTSLSANAAGFARTAGSFIADGFSVGMEVTPDGFANNEPALVTAVDALQLSVKGGRVADVEQAGRSLVCALPVRRAWENLRFDMLDGRWFLDEDYLPGPSRRITVGPNAQMEHSPVYVLKLSAPAGYGIAAPYRMAQAIIDRFAPGLEIYLSNGDVLRVRGDTAPYRGQLVTRDGFAQVVVTIPLRMQTTNPI